MRIEKQDLEMRLDNVMSPGYEGWAWLAKLR
jgi:hypothetical protein